MNFELVIRKREMDNIIIFHLMRVYKYQRGDLEITWLKAATPLIYSKPRNTFCDQKNNEIGWVSDY